MFPDHRCPTCSAHGNATKKKQGFNAGADVYQQSRHDYLGTNIKRKYLCKAAPKNLDSHVDGSDYRAEEHLPLPLETILIF